jgi:hypothetical protein
MEVLHGSSSPAVKCAALEAVATLVKGDNKLKVNMHQDAAAHTSHWVQAQVMS